MNGSSTIEGLSRLRSCTVVGAILYFGGVFKKKTEVDINVTKPGLVLLVRTSPGIDCKIGTGKFYRSGQHLADHFAVHVR